MTNIFRAFEIKTPEQYILTAAFVACLSTWASAASSDPAHGSDRHRILRRIELDAQIVATLLSNKTRPCRPRHDGYADFVSPNDTGPTPDVSDPETTETKLPDRRRVGDGRQVSCVEPAIVR